MTICQRDGSKNNAATLLRPSMSILYIVLLIRLDQVHISDSFFVIVDFICERDFIVTPSLPTDHCTAAVSP